MSTRAIPTLHTSRLTLRGLGEADYTDLLALAHDQAVSQYLHEGPPPSITDIAQRVEGSHRQWVVRGYGMIAVEDINGFVGRLGIFQPSEAADPLLVYALNRRSWGQGYATEGVLAFLRWLYENCGPMTVFAHIDPRNSGSTRVMMKLGGVQTGVMTRGDIELNVWTLSAQKLSATANHETNACGEA